MRTNSETFNLKIEHSCSHMKHQFAEISVHTGSFSYSKNYVILRKRESVLIFIIKQVLFSKKIQNF